MTTGSNELPALKRCPFCGWAARLLNDSAAEYGPPSVRLDFAVTCDGCDLVLPWTETPADAIAAWNRRAGEVSREPSDEARQVSGVTPQTTALPLTFEELQATNVRRCVEGFGHALESWSPAEWTNAMCGEAGESANITKKMIRIRDGAKGNKADDATLDFLRAKLRGELADVVIYASLTAASQGIDLGDAVRDTFNAKSREIGCDILLAAPRNEQEK